MTRDELIEELKKIPTNGTVLVRVAYQGRDGFGMRSGVRLSFVGIEQIIAFPNPVILTEETR